MQPEISVGTHTKNPDREALEVTREAKIELSALISERKA